MSPRERTTLTTTATTTRTTTVMPRARIAITALSLILCAPALALPGCKSDAPRAAAPRVAPTCAGAEVLHAGVTVRTAAGESSSPRADARVEVGGTVTTAAAGRAVLHTDDGLEIRVAGDSEVSFADGHARLARGKMFVTSWGDGERTVRVGERVTLGVGDAALEAEALAGGEVRVVAVRGELSWRLPDRQGRLQQGESLEGRGAPEVRAAGVWDDWTGGAASPQGAANRGALGSGAAVVHADNGDAPAALAVNEHHVSVRVEGDLAVTTVSQRFFNGVDRGAAVEYRVRLPSDAMVADFAVERANFGSAVHAAPGTVSSLNHQGGGYPALLSTPEGELYASVGMLRPGQTVRCEITYAQWLRHEQGRRAYLYPMGDPASPPFVGEFSFELDAGRGHAAAVRGPEGSVVRGQRVRLAKSDYRPRADVAVDLFDDTAPAENSARVWQSWTTDADERYLLADVTLPAPADRGTDLVLLLDDSGAMDPGTLSVAAAAVNAVLQTVGPDDRVALVYGDLRGRPAEGSAGQLRAVDPARREAILDAVAHATPGGATNLGRMLADAYMLLDPQRNGAVLYLGDAMPTMGALDPGQLVDETLRVAPDLRLYAITLGDEQHPEVLQRLASRGGMVERALDQAEAVSAAQRLAAHAMRPVLRDVTVDLGPGVERPLPAVVPQWVAGDPLRIVGRMTGTAPREITVRARGLAQPVKIAVKPEAIHDAGDIRRRWGAARLAALESSGAGRGALADLGVRFGLITPMSALIIDGPSRAEGGEAGVEAAGSLWPDLGVYSRLPHLGVDEGVEPRGVRSTFEVPDYPMVTDDGSGWQRHTPGEGAGSTNMLSLALAAADADARACFERARTLRPNLRGSVSVSATVDANGRVTASAVAWSSLSDANTENCIKRAVAGLVLPMPGLFGARPGVVQRTFDFSNVYTVRRGRACPASSRLPRVGRMVLWRERIQSQRGQWLGVFNQATDRCELRTWEDRTALLSLIVRETQDPAQLAELRRTLEDPARVYLDREVSRRWGPSALYRAYVVATSDVDWDALLKKLNDGALPTERKIEIARAYLALAPRDIDLRIRLMALYERAAGETPAQADTYRRQARRVAAELRLDPYADSRVRELVGEMFLRAGDRDEGLRAFSEIAEYAPYDTNARGMLGDLLLTYGGADWAEDAYQQYRTLAALRPGETAPRVRMALAALMARREDESLRLLRSVAEESGGDAASPAAEALLVSEVARLAAAHPGDNAVQGWARVARLMGLSRDGGVVASWHHPDVTLDVRAMTPGDTVFFPVGDASSPFNVRVFSPGSALEGSRLIVRAQSGLAGARAVTAHLALLEPQAQSQNPRLVERDVTLDARSRVLAFVVRNGALVEDTAPVPESERPPPLVEMY